MTSFVKKSKQVVKNYWTDFKLSPKKYTTVLGGSILLCSLGTVSLIGTASPYFMSYMREKNGLNVRYSQAVYLSALQNFCIGIAATMCGFLKYKFNVSIKLLGIIGSILHFGGLLLSMFTLKISFFMFAVTLGCIYGVGYGMTYIVPLSMAMEWWSGARGKSSAVVMFGFGIGGLVFQEFVTVYINPTNLLPDKAYSDSEPNEKYFSDEDLLDRVPYSFLIVSIIAIVLSSLGLLMMFDKPKEPESLVANEKTNEKPTLTFSQAIKIPEVYMLCIMSSLFFFGPLNFNVYFKSFGQIFIFDDQFLTAIKSASSILNIFTKILWGWILDKFSFKMTYLTTNTLTMVFLFTLAINEYIDFKWLYALWCFIINFCEVGILLIMPIIQVKVFGQQNLLLIHGIASLIALPSIVLSVFFSPAVLDNFGYFALFSSSCFFSAIAWCVGACFNVRNKDGTDI